MAIGLPKRSIAALTMLLLGLVCGATARAQVSTDGTVGPRVELDGPEFDIDADLGRQAGRNLFHSFDQFSLTTGERATFSGPDQIRNVISRVTGGERSDIDGTIRSTIEGADFYFINPAGVLFGANASLDVQGSFYVSTADELRFTDGATFSADLDTRSSFTVARPEAFGFLGGDRGALRVADSRLKVRSGEAISLVGGNVTITGADDDNPTIGASRGLITVGAVGVEGGRFALRSGRLDAPERAGITIADGAFLDTTGDGGGTIRIEGGRLVVHNSFVFADNDGSSDATGGIDIGADRVILRNGSVVGADALSSGDAGLVRVNARLVAIRNGSFFSSDVRAAGNGGTVDVEADSILISGDGAESFTGMGTEVLFGTGRGGQTIVRASDLRILGGGQISGSTSASGNAGDVTVEAESLSIFDGGIFSEAEPGSTGAGGEVTVTTTGLLEIRDQSAISSSTFAAGDAGNLTVSAEHLRLLDGGQISSGSAGESTGAGGDVRVAVSDRLLIAGQGSGGLPSGILAPAQGAAVSDSAAGNLTVTAGTIELRDRGLIDSSTATAGDAGRVQVTTTGLLEIRDESEIISSTSSIGGAGTVTVDAGELIVDASGSSGRVLTGIASQSEGAGRAGAVLVEAERIELRDDGAIQAVSQEEDGGPAGAITIRASDRLIMDGGLIRTDSEAAGGGEIRLNVGSVIDLHDSFIVTTVAGGDDPTAGNILVNAEVLVIDNSLIQANAPVGFGGDLTIVANNIVVPEGDFQALLDRGEISATGGDPTRAGTIAVNAPEIDLGGDLVILQVPLLNTAALLGEPCGVRRDIGASSLTGVGRGGLPPGPDQPLISDYTTVAAPRAGTARSGEAEAEVAFAPVLLVQPCAGAL